MGSVLVVYRREIARLLTFDTAAVRYLTALAIGTVPAVLVGLLLRPQVTALFASPRSAAVCRERLKELGQGDPYASFDQARHDSRVCGARKSGAAA